MRYYILSFLMLFLGQRLWAQPSAVKNAGKSVFTLTTFKADGSLLASSHGVFIDGQGTCVSDWTPFAGADHAVVVDASGKKMDMRMLGYGAYPYLDFEPISDTQGDSYARCYCRMMEIYQSIDLIKQAIPKIPAETDLVVPIKGNPDGEYFFRAEQPRGEAIYYVKGHGKPFIDRLRVRTPTFANLPALCEMLKDTSLADVGLLILTIDPCISCTER